MKRFFLVVLVGLTAIFLLRRILSNRLEEAYAPVSTLGKKQTDLFGMVKELQSDPKIKEYLDFVTAHFPQMPETEEKDGRVIIRFGDDTFDITDLRENPIIQGLKSKLEIGPQPA